ncbi:MAG: type II secretion system protein GspD [Planctomycetes bacterium]|nr:type II secretion system protein GspD [Planctomycetota bacterium]
MKPLPIVSRAARLATLLLGLLLVTATAAAQDGGEGLDQIVETLDLREVPLREALRLLTEESGVNLIASEEAGSHPVTCYLLDVPLRQAIETIAKNHGLWFKIERDSKIVRLMTAKEFERDLVLFRDEQTKVFTLFFPNSVDIAVAIRNLFGSRVRLSLDRELMTDEYTEILQRFQRFDVVDRRGQSLGISGGGQFQQNSQYTPGLRTAQGVYNQPQQAAPQPGTANGRDRTDDLTPEQIERLQQAIESEGGELDPGLVAELKGQQTSIYVTIHRRNNMIAVRSSDAAAMEQIESLVRQLDVPTPQVLLEVKILLVDLGDDFRSAFDAQYSGDRQAGSFATGDILSGGGVPDPTALIYQFVNDHFAARLQLLQVRNRVTTLATPLLLVANNEVSRLFVGEERPIIRNISSQTTVSQASTTITPANTVELRPVGTTLLITPNINADRTVTLRILNELSAVRESAGTIPVVTSDGNVITQPVDTVSSRSLSGTLVAHDGLTLALGGLVQEDIEVSQEGVPLLMDLPLIGSLFRREVKTRTHSELVVLIRPYVLFTPAEGREISQRLVDKLSVHPAAASLGEPMGTFGKDEAPRPPLGQNPLLEMLEYQSGLPGGR